MPGDNCSVYNCGLCRREHGVGIFQVPGKPTEKQMKRAETSPTFAKKLALKAKWRAEFIKAVKKTRIADAAFQQLIKNDRVFACERHFLPSEVISHKGAKMTKHTLVPGATPRYNMCGLSENDERLNADASISTYDETGKKEVRLCAVPTINLPVKSHETPKPPQRRPIIRKPLPAASAPKTCYKNFNDLVTRTLKLKLKGWSSTIVEKVTAKTVETPATETTTETETQKDGEKPADAATEVSATTVGVSVGVSWSLVTPPIEVKDEVAAATADITGSDEPTQIAVIPQPVASVPSASTATGTEFTAKAEATYDVETTTTSASTTQATTELAAATAEISTTEATTELSTSSTGSASTPSKPATNDDTAPNEVSLFLVLALNDDEGKFRIPKFEIYITEKFEIFCYVFGWRLSHDQEFIKGFSLKDDTVSTLINNIQHLQVCQGVGEDVDYHGILHSVPYNIDIMDEKSFSCKSFRRPDECLLLMTASTDTEMCKVCCDVTKADARKKAKLEKINNTPAHPNAPLTQTHPKRIALALKEERRKNRELEEKLREKEADVRTVYVPMMPVMPQDFNPRGPAPTHRGKRHQPCSAERSKKQKDADYSMEIGSDRCTNPTVPMAHMVPMPPMCPPLHTNQEVETIRKKGSDNGVVEEVSVNPSVPMVHMVPMPPMFPPNHTTNQENETNDKEIFDEITGTVYSF